MWSGARAAVGVVAELVDVHAAVGGGVVASDVVGDGRRGGFGRLLEGDGSADFGVTAEDCDCCSGERGSCQLGYVLREEMKCGGKGRAGLGRTCAELAG